MVIRGKSRGNGKQLALYLLAKRDNDYKPIVLQMRGFADRDPKTALANADLDVAAISRSNKALYHGILNPREGEASDMSEEQWVFAADVMEKYLKYEDLPRLIVKHEKAGRAHVHVVWLRYDYNTTKLRPDTYNFYKHNSARADIEKALGHERTNHRRNRMNEPGHKELLTLLWNKSTNATEFLEQAQNVGYEIGKGLDHRPYRVITPEGTSLDLVRQLDGIRKRDVQERFKRFGLPTEAQALQANQQRHNKTFRQTLEQDRQANLWQQFINQTPLAEIENSEESFKQLLEEYHQHQSRKNNQSLDLD